VRENNRQFVIFALGFCTIPAQIILLREFLLVFGGNELIIGLFLATWMMLTALGSFAAKYLRIPDPHIPYYSVVLAWLPVFLLYATDFLRNKLLLPGIEPGLFQVLVSSCILLLPFCFLSGLLFASAAYQLTRAADQEKVDKAYGIESAGSLCGGILFSIVLVYLVDNFRSAAVVALLSSILVMFFRNGEHRNSIVVILPVLIFSSAILLSGSRFPRHFLFCNQELLENRDTPYGNLAITRTTGQLNFYENNTLLFSTDNQLASEEAVHFAMLQHPLPKRVLLVSGGIAGLTKEILKYKSVENLEYIEIDPVILKLGRKYTPFLKDKRIRAVSDDPRIYLRKTHRKYDVVIIFLPPPSSFQLNRFYTSEFMSEIKRAMNPKGIFSFSLPLAGNYLNEGALSIYSSLFNTSALLFRDVRLFPGQSCYFVASDQPIKTNIDQLIEIKNIATDYVNSYYITEPELIRNSLTIKKQLKSSISTNTDFNPVAVSGYYHYWVRRFRLEFTTFRYLAVLLSIAVFLSLSVASPAYSGIFTAGFTSSSLQVILILSFQIVCGYMYRSIGLFTAVFMAGLALGALFRRQIIRPATGGLVYLLLLQAGLSALVPLMISLSVYFSFMPILVHLNFLIMTGLISLSTGLVFSLSVEASHKQLAVKISGIYGSDLAGASLGAFMTTLVLIHLAGMRSAPYTLCFLNVIVACIIVMRRSIFPADNEAN
jgi:spermidine synthase